ncbi:chorismate synthase [Clostridia bacterium]|nr:chorismate synthase [Clostridia bacterium]
MSSFTGEKISVNIFGESHGAAVGAVIEGLPAGEIIDRETLRAFVKLRAPGAAHTTPRKEADEVKILSGTVDIDDRTFRLTGTPVALIIENTDTRSGDYSKLENIPRPGHSDYAAHVKYAGNNDIRGGGHFSARITAATVAAGGIALQILRRRNIFVGGRIVCVGRVSRGGFAEILPAELSAALLNRAENAATPEMVDEIKLAAAEHDSVGAVIECGIAGLPAGLGGPHFSGVESRIAAAVFGIPAVKGVEFGAGFAGSVLRGSESNDAFVIKNGKVQTETNRHGGILGGITSGMPIIFRAAFKATPSIGKEQDSVNLSDMEPAKLTITGRHDPCVGIRALPVVEAVAALCTLDLTIL